MSEDDPAGMAVWRAVEVPGAVAEVRSVAVPPFANLGGTMTTRG